MLLLHLDGSAKFYEMVGGHRMIVVWRKGERYDTGARVGGGRPREGRR